MPAAFVRPHAEDPEGGPGAVRHAPLTGLPIVAIALVAGMALARSSLDGDSPNSVPAADESRSVAASNRDVPSHDQGTDGDPTGGGLVGEGLVGEGLVGCGLVGDAPLGGTPLAGALAAQTIPRGASTQGAPNAERPILGDRPSERSARASITRPGERPSEGSETASPHPRAGASGVGDGPDPLRGRSALESLRTFVCSCRSVSPTARLDAWLVLSLVTLALAVLAAWRGGRAAWWILAAAAAAIGGTWSMVPLVRVGTESLARMNTETPAAHWRGMARGAAQPAPRRGSMADFDPRPPRWRFEMEIDQVAVGGRFAAARGRAWVSVAARPPPFGAGDRLDVFGRLSPFRPPRNPGEFDGVAWSRAEGIAGTIWADEASSVVVVSAPSWKRSAGSAVDLACALGVRARATLRDLASTALLRGLPSSVDAEQRALLRAMFLGERDAALAPLEGAFQRTGTVHLIAISGFNMAVLAAAAVVLLRPFGRRPVGKPARGTMGAPHGKAPAADPSSRAGGPTVRWHAWAVVATVSIYLLAIEWQPAVLRAGAMIVVASVGSAFGRHWRISGVVSAAALVLLLPGPGQLENAGFQLSFAVVGALVWLAPPLRRRLFGPPDPHASTIAAVVRERCKSAVACAVAAWLIATPLSLHHFGIVSPLAAPLSLVATPLAAGLLTVGYLKMFVTPIAPLAGMVLGWLVAPLTQAFMALIRAADGVPGAVFHLPSPGVAWTLASTVALAGAILLRGRALAACCAIAVVLGGAALWPLRPWSHQPPLRVDMLDVGDGSCLLIRSARTAVVFDAGSTNVGVGERTLVPALRALGVRRIAALIVSHPNLDHYDGVLELADAFAIDEVVLTHAFDRVAAREPRGPITRLVDGLAARHVDVRRGAAGDIRRYGVATFTWLHPEDGAWSRRLNDTSQVVRVEAQGRTLLLCGDIEDEAIAAVRHGTPELRADIVELPHHGSWRESSVELVSSLDPAVILQSTGPRRLRPDRWSAVMGSRTRLVTAERGCVTVVVDDRGAMTTSGWRRPSTNTPPAPVAPRKPAVEFSQRE
ncbi:MAG: ComEC/Rec2 family competence protein [Phycisphaerales bacterium]